MRKDRCLWKGWQTTIHRGIKKVRCGGVDSEYDTYSI